MLVETLTYAMFQVCAEGFRQNSHTSRLLTDEEAAKQFLKNCTETTGVIPDHVTTDHDKAFPSSIDSTLGKKAEHHTNQILRIILWNQIIVA